MTAPASRLPDAVPPEMAAELAFTPPRLGARAFGWRLIFLMACFALGLSANPAGGLQARQLIELVVAGMAALCLAAGASLWLQRRQGPGPPLRFELDGLRLPVNANSRRTRLVPYADIRSVTVPRARRFGVLVIDTKSRVFVYPLDRFADPDPLARLRNLLRAHVLDAPGGQAQWAEVERREEIAMALRVQRPLATYAVMAVITIAYLLELVWQRLTGAPEDGFFGLDLGANAAALVGDGQYYRLVSANLLHASALHLFTNGFSLLALGTILERLLGWRHFLLLILATGLLSQAVSALAAPELGSYVYSVGISGALFGLVGALGVVSWRFGRQLPGGYRVVPRAWMVLILVNFVAIPMVFPQVDRFAHGGGLVAGAVMAWLLFGRSAQVEDLARTKPGPRILLASLAALWAISLIQAGAHAADRGAALADRTLIMRAALAGPHVSPDMQNGVAYGIALRADAGADAWRLAQELEDKAIDNAVRRHAPPQELAEFEDTAALLSFRLGDLKDAALRQARLIRHITNEMTDHLVLFLDAATASGAPLMVGGDVPPPGLRIQSGAVVMRASAPIPRGAEIFALVRHDGELRGLIYILVPAGFAPSTVTLAPIRHGPPAIALPDDSDTLEVSLIDSTGCHCKRTAPAAHWLPAATTR
jgi:rhomboid protease GluP